MELCEIGGKRMRYQANELRYEQITVLEKEAIFTELRVLRGRRRDDVFSKERIGTIAEKEVLR